MMRLLSETKQYWGQQTRFVYKAIQEPVTKLAVGHVGLQGEWIFFLAEMRELHPSYCG